MNNNDFHKKATILLAVILFVVASSIGVFTAYEAAAQVRPAIIKNIDEPGRIPYQQFLSSAYGGPNCGTNFCGFLLPAVPANKRLVITNISGTINLDATATVQHLRLTVYDASFNILSQIHVPYNPNAYPQDTISANNPRRYVVNEQLQWFVEGGQQPRLDFHTTGGSLTTMWPNQFLITGYLVDLNL